MSIQKAYTIGGGSTVTTWDNTNTNTVEYQTVTAHGNATVSDDAQPTVIKYGQGYVTLGPWGYTTGTKTGLVHIPIAAPIAMSIKTALLQNIVVKFSSTDATIHKVYLNYDKDQVASSDVDKSDSFYVVYSGTECSNAGYSADNPRGISLTFEIHFTSSTANIQLEAVQIVYLYKSASS
jgi:hypothetical protein